eukprot:2931510-Rhodomonas_salina.1
MRASDPDVGQGGQVERVMQLGGELEIEAVPGAAPNQIRTPACPVPFVPRMALIWRWSATRYWDLLAAYARATRCPGLAYHIVLRMVLLAA